MNSLQTTTERLDAFARFTIAYGVLVLLVFFTLISLPYPFTGSIKPPLFLTAIYYWCLYRPGLMPMWFVFVAGILLDLLGGVPLGLNALVFVIVRWVIADQRRFLTSQSFVVVWIGFSLVALVAGLLQWGIFGVTGSGWLPLQSIVLSVLFGVILFPPVSLVLHLTLKILPAPAQERESAHFSVSRRRKR